MDILYTNCAGLDVHKKTGTVCVLTQASTGQLEKQLRTYFTTVEELLKLSDWPKEQGCTHIAFEATGLVSVMAEAVQATRMGWGVCTIVGVAGKGETLEIVPRLLITGRRVRGSSFGGLKGRDQVPELVDLYMRGALDVDPFISHRMPLADVNRAFELMAAQDGIRSVLMHDGV